MPKSVSPRAHPLCAVIAAAAAALALLAALAVPASAVESRGYELVSPPDKAGGGVTVQWTRTRAAVDGGAATFVSLTGFADAHGTGVASEYMAQRLARAGTPGWETHAITPPQDPLTLLGLFALAEPVFAGEMSPDLSRGVVRAWSPLTDDPLVADVQNLYVRRDLREPGPGTYELLTGCPGCAATPLTVSVLANDLPFHASATDDVEHVVFESTRNLTGDGDAARKVYASDGGAVRLVGLIPAGTDTSCGGSGPACVLPPTNSGTSTAGLGGVGDYVPRVLSDDGRYVTFTAFVTTSGNIVSGGAAGNRSKLYQRDSRGTTDPADDTTVRINVTERTTPATAQAAVYQMASADGSRVLFTSSEALTDSAPASGTHLYMWDRDTPNDEEQRLAVRARGGSFTLTFDGQQTDPIDFNAAASTVASELNDLSTIGGVGGEVTVSGGPGDPDGSTPYEITFGGNLAGRDQPLIVVDGGGLSGDAPGANVAPWSRGGGHLTLIDEDREPADGVAQSDGVVHVSEAGDYVYFVSRSQLLQGEQALPPGQLGLYLWHDGEIRFIGYFGGGIAGATVRNLIAGNGNGTPWGLVAWHARLTPDGQHLLFVTNDGSGFTGYDHGGTEQYYLYSAETDDLVCVTCNPNAASGSASASIVARVGEGGMTTTSHLNRPLSDDGRRVFFSTGEALVPEDRNGRIDAYVYDVETGTHSLISSGESSSHSYFMDASTSGDDVFFLTRERLVGWDVDNQYDLYDARVGGGVPDPVQPLAPCVGDDCQGPLSGTPAGPLVGSASFAGAGNERAEAPRARRGRRARRSRRAKRCKRGRVRMRVRGRARCVTRVQARRIKARRADRREARRAANERRAR